MTLDLDTALTLHLYRQPTANGVQYQSSLIALLGDARGACERDGETGQVLPGKRSASWLGAAGYLILLDQIGTCFGIPGTPAREEHPLLHALRSFSPIHDEPTLQALYALRCALAHDYALFNNGSTKGGNVRPLLRHAFNFTADPTSPLVELPKTTWAGPPYDLKSFPPDEETTVVNLRALGDLVEKVVEDLRRRHAAGTLAILLPLDEFHMRYGMRYQP